jgi:alanyl-tRNA synthetase
MSADDLQSMARKAEAIFTKPTALYSEKDKTVVLATPGTPAAGQLVKDYANMYGGKGGGSKTLARAIFTKKADAELFMDLIEKHLR